MLKIDKSGKILFEDSDPDLCLNCFYELEAPKGRRRFILLSKVSVNPRDLTIDKDVPVGHSSEFLQYYVMGVEQTVLGSVLDIRAKFCTVNSVSVSYNPPSDEGPFVCPTESSSGGLLVYQNNHGQFLAISAKSCSNRLLVTDKGEV